MKFKSKVFVPLVVFLVIFGQGKKLTNEPCHLQILVDDYAEWHDLWEGFIYSLYESPGAKVT